MINHLTQFFADLSPWTFFLGGTALLALIVFLAILVWRARAAELAPLDPATVEAMEGLAQTMSRIENRLASLESLARERSE